MAAQHRVERRKGLPGDARYGVYRADGRRMTARHTMLAAEEAADMLMGGVPVRSLPRERVQIMKRLPKMKVTVDVGGRLPYAVVRESDGFLIRRFQLDFDAKWWHETYMWRRQSFRSGGTRDISLSEASALLDALNRGYQ